jgi:hypothetical protein
VTNVGLKSLVGYRNLKHLDLSFTEVTDADLIELEHLSGLGSLVLLNSKVTDNGISRLQKILPKCRIDHYPLPQRLHAHSSHAYASRLFERGEAGHRPACKFFQ